MLFLILIIIAKISVIGDRSERQGIKVANWIVKKLKEKPCGFFCSHYRIEIAFIG